MVPVVSCFQLMHVPLLPAQICSPNYKASACYSSIWGFNSHLAEAEAATCQLRAHCTHLHARIVDAPQIGHGRRPNISMEGTEEVGQVEKWLEDELEEELEALQIILGDDVRHIQRYGKADPLHSHPDRSSYYHAPPHITLPKLLFQNFLYCQGFQDASLLCSPAYQPHQLDSIAFMSAYHSANRRLMCSVLCRYPWLAKRCRRLDEGGSGLHTRGTCRCACGCIPAVARRAARPSAAGLPRGATDHPRRTAGATLRIGT